MSDSSTNLSCYDIIHQSLIRSSFTIYLHAEEARQGSKSYMRLTYKNSTIPVPFLILSKQTFGTIFVSETVYCNTKSYRPITVDICLNIDYSTPFTCHLSRTFSLGDIGSWKPSLVACVCNFVYHWSWQLTRRISVSIREPSRSSCCSLRSRQQRD